MKQHLLASQLKEVDLEDRITLLSLATGLTKEYVRDEYRKGMKNEEGMLIEYGFALKIGELMEIIQDFTGQFPIPEIASGRYRVKIAWKDLNGRDAEADSEFQANYCDALYEVVKQLLKGKHILMQ
ncbi:hypothetical protein HMPREF1982_04326 [Clostridiales bacterium oral taxon 876 str. F0540]|nr:hypothetical protein HMPREF1982_04326 [Clostridiales bacterium oral taxon 876 str. F0540]